MKKAGADFWVNFFIPEADIYNPASFKSWLDLAHLRVRWKLQANGKSWRDMIDKRLGIVSKYLMVLLGLNYCLDLFEEIRFKEKILVEKVGAQTQTSSKDPENLSLRRIVVGPSLYFRADGTRDTAPIHYWGSVIKD